MLLQGHVVEVPEPPLGARCCTPTGSVREALYRPVGADAPPSDEDEARAAGSGPATLLQRRHLSGLALGAVALLGAACFAGTRALGAAPSEAQPVKVPGGQPSDIQELRFAGLAAQVGYVPQTQLRGMQDQSEQDLLLPWPAAIAKATRIEAMMTDTERYTLITGLGFLTVGAWVGATNAVPRLGVPALKMQDASSGFRPMGASEFGTVTSWPSMLCMASTWDEALVKKSASAIAREFRGKGANVLLGPGVNVHRTPWGGRNWEYLSGEDPYLGERLAPAYVHGIQSQGVMAVVKHFAFNEQETERNSMNAIVDQKTAWELYYPPFQAAVEAGAGAVMCSYNRVNGTYACENPDTLLHDLKMKMGFSGFVMSDWDAVHSTNAIENGLDMEMPNAKWLKRDKMVGEHHGAMRNAACRVLSSIYHLRLDESPGCELPCDLERASVQRGPQSLQVALEGATDGIVMLKNNGMLPLKVEKFRKIAVIGSGAQAQDTMNTWGPGSPYSGGGSGHIAAPIVITPLDGIRARGAQAQVEVLSWGDFDDPDNGLISSENTAGADVPQASEGMSRRLGPLTEEQLLEKRLSKIAQEVDVAVVVGASTATESADRMSLDMDEDANDMITRLASKMPVVVLMEVPGPVTTPWRDEVAASLILFHGGEMTGKAWAQVLFGDAQPSGKLPVTMPATLDGLARPMPGDVRYSEALLTSYRSPFVRAAYPFGHGLTYTTFEYGTPAAELAGCTVQACVSVPIKNSGYVAGREVVQAYIEFERDTREPRLLLKGFQKTGVLQPGEEEVVTFSFRSRDLSVFEAGIQDFSMLQEMKLLIGSSSVDIRKVVRIRIG